MTTLTWITCGGDSHWCALESVDLSKISAEGVYVIWHQANPTRTVRVGQGDIAERLGEHRRDQTILAYRRFGTLRVTWAAAPASQLDGIERYLASQLSPLTGDAFPAAQPIPVNLPRALAA